MASILSIAGRPVGWRPAARSVRRFLSVSAAITATFLASASANACVLGPVEFFGTAAEKAALQTRAGKVQRVEARSRQRAFGKAVRAGTEDSADGLAVLLIPNVREWYADHSDCGPSGDGDGLHMPDSFIVREAFIGSELDGLGDDQLKDIVSTTFIRTAIAPYRRSCNDEIPSPVRAKAAPRRAQAPAESRVFVSKRKR